MTSRHATAWQGVPLTAVSDAQLRKLWLTGQIPQADYLEECARRALPPVPDYGPDHAHDAAGHGARQDADDPWAALVEPQPGERALRVIAGLLIGAQLGLVVVALVWMAVSAGLVWTALVALALGATIGGVIVLAGRAWRQTPPRDEGDGR
jgi:hypothetical protein